MTWLFCYTSLFKFTVIFVFHLYLGLQWHVSMHFFPSPCSMTSLWSRRLRTSKCIKSGSSLLHRALVLTLSPGSRSAASIQQSDWLSAQLLHHLPGLCISSAPKIFKGLPHSKVLKTHTILVLSLFVSGIMHIIQEVDILVGLLQHVGYNGLNLKGHFTAMEPKGVQRKGIVHFCFI